MQADTPVGASIETTPGWLPGTQAAQVELVADPSVFTVLDVLGRTEDVVVAPSGQRLAIAGFVSNSIAIVELGAATTHGLHVQSIRVVHSVALAHPHGLDFLDERTLVVANRNAELLVVELADPLETGPTGRLTADVHVVVDGSSSPPVRTPGSVVARRLAPGVVEVYVCNNYANDVTRHTLARTHPGAAGWVALEGDVVLADGLEIPDGVALSGDGQWLAVSNHGRHEVVVHEVAQLSPEAEPAARLTGVDYPHGVRFTPDSRHLVVADAGAPFVHVFTAADAVWSGTRTPERSIRVMDEATFLRGRDNPEEGGPKGLALLSDGRLVLTSEHQPLVCVDLGLDVAPLRAGARPVGEFEVGALLARMGQRLRDSETTAAAIEARLTEQLAHLDTELTITRDRLAALEHRLVERDATAAAATADAEASRIAATEAQRRADDAAARLAAIEASTAWRASAPARRLGDLARRRPG